MVSMMSLLTYSRPTGCKAAKTRKTKPSTTAVGPESQTIFSTGGRLRRADMRSCHALVIFLCGSVMNVCGPHLDGRACAAQVRGAKDFPNERCGNPLTSFIACHGEGLIPS